MMLLYLLGFIALVCLVLLSFFIGYVRGRTDAYLGAINILREQFDEYFNKYGGKK